MKRERTVKGKGKERPTAGTRPGRGTAWLVAGFAGLCAGGLWLAVAKKLAPPWVPAVYAVASGLSLIAYAWDKSRARRGVWRISESTLHFFDAAGGWPGGWMAQRIFRHKTRKLSFQLAFWLTVAAHLAGWGWWYSRHQAGEPLLPTL